MPTSDRASAASRKRRLLALLVAVLGCALLSYNLATSFELFNWRRRFTGPLAVRYWEDATVAIRRGLDHVSPDVGAIQEAPNREEASALCQELVMRRIAPRNSGFQPWRFWQTLPWTRFAEFRGKFPKDSRPFEDWGRPDALSEGFRLLGGMAPFLGLWLSALTSFPILLWTTWELFGAKRPVAAIAFLLTFVCSSYVVDCFAWLHAGIGFYLIAHLAIVALAVYGLMSPSVSLAALAVRVLGAGVVFAACAFCRSSTVLLGPGFLLAVGLCVSRHLTEVPGARRAFGLPERLGVLFLGLAFFSLPYLLLRQPRHHAVWISIWEGLGDFDRTKEHSWHDPDALRILHRAHIATGASEYSTWVDHEQWVTDEVEDFFRHSVLRDVREDPGWYLAILGNRIFATVTQKKLWPWGPRDGRSYAKKTHPNEGEIDHYYRATRTVDLFSLGRFQVELPISLLIAPTIVVALLGGARWIRREVGALTPLGVLFCLSAASIVTPVLVTTAGAQETQAFGVVYFLGFALFLEELARWTSGALTRSRR